MLSEWLATNTKKQHLRRTKTYLKDVLLISFMGYQKIGNCWNCPSDFYTPRNLDVKTHKYDVLQYVVGCMNHLRK